MPPVARHNHFAPGKVIASARGHERVAASLCGKDAPGTPPHLVRIRSGPRRLDDCYGIEVRLERAVRERTKGKPNGAPYLPPLCTRRQWASGIDRARAALRCQPAMRIAKTVAGLT
jgi:hypothetical protein